MGLEDINEMKKNKDVDGLINFVLNSDNEIQCSIAAGCIAEIGDKSIIQPLLKIVTDESIDPVRRSFLTIPLGEIKDPISVKPLLELLDHPDDELRCEVICTLGELGDSRAVDPLIECLQDPYDLIKSNAVDALRTIGDPKGIEKAEEIHRQLPDKIIVKWKKTDKEIKEEEQFERNIKAKELEKKGEVDKAIELYESNIEENHEGNFPYDRLAIIYRKRKEYDEEIRVLEKAIWVFENIVFKERADRNPKLKKFNDRLIKSRELKAKNT